MLVAEAQFRTVYALHVYEDVVKYPVPAVDEVAAVAQVLQVPSGLTYMQLVGPATQETVPAESTYL